MIKSIITDQICMDLNEALTLAKSLGYSFIELHGVWGKTIEECDEAEVEQIKVLLKHHHLKVSNLATTVFFMCKLKEDYVLKSFKQSFVVTSAASISDHLLALEKACRIAEKLDCPNIRIFPFRYPENHTLVGTEEDLELIAQVFSKAVKIAEHYKVTLIVENCPYSHCPKPLMTLKLIQKVNHPQLKLLYDPGNSYRADIQRVPNEYLKTSVSEELEIIHDQINHMHLKNYKFDPTCEKPFIHTSLNKGDLDYRKIIKQLNKYEYKQALSLEPEVSREDVIDSMKALNQLLLED